MNKEQKLKFWWGVMKRRLHSSNKLSYNELLEVGEYLKSHTTSEWATCDTYLDNTPVQLSTIIFQKEINTYKSDMIQIIGKRQYRRWLNNIKQQHKWRLEELGIDDIELLANLLIIRYNFSPSMIDNTLIWSRTNEGWDFWNRLNEQMIGYMQTKLYYLNTCEK